MTTFVDLVQTTVYSAVQKKEVAVWDSLMERNYPALTMKTVKVFILGWSVWKTRGALYATYEFFCNLPQFGERLKDEHNKRRCKERLYDVVPSV